jgi:uncharacterized protein YprB with RNaseH-like and TPR domain
MTKKLRCVHRQDIKHHPSCFRKGLVKYSNDREFEKITGKPWYNFPDYKIGYFDIETTADFNADWGTVLSWCIKDKGGDIHSSVITKKELFDGDLDKRVVKEFVDILRDYQIIIGYYSDRFDMPFMRTKALHYGFNFPGYGELYHWDLYYFVRNKLKLSRNSLANVTEFLHIEGKTPIDKAVWLKARYGDPDALALVLEHNKYDVIITELLHDKIEFTRKWLRRSI